MFRINSNTSFQPVNAQSTEQTESRSSAISQPQATEQSTTSDATSVNTRQRASLVQDGEMQKAILNQKLPIQHEIKAIEKNKEAAESSSFGNQLFGTIFGGPLIGTNIGGPIAKETDLKEKTEHLQKEIDRMREEIKNTKDQSAELDDIGDWLIGADKGASSETNLYAHIQQKLVSKDDDDND